MKTRNLIGRQVQKLRVAKQWSQKKLAEQLQLGGLDKSREAVARIEAQLVSVREYEMLFIAEALEVPWPILLADVDPNKKALEVVEALMKPRPSTAPKWGTRKSRNGRKLSR
jgi:transcriptional regulator with XRE-family HTH domain